MDQEQLNRELLEAAESGDTKSVEDWVARGADVNCKNEGGYSPLHLAAEQGHTETVSRLVELGGDINAKDEDGRSPLHEAAAWGHIETVSRLVELGGDVHAKDVDGVSPLHWAAAGGRTETVSRLVDLGGDINSKDNKGQTPYDVSRKDEIRELLKSYMSRDEDTTRIPHTVKDDALPGIDDPVEFKSLLKQGGTYKSYGNRIYLAGACSVGKSTLASLLIGDEIPLEWKSTDGLKIFFGRNGIHLEERKMVPLNKDEENQNILANVLRGQPGMDKSQQDINFQQQAITVSTGLESTQEEAAAQLMSGVSTKQQIMKERKTQQAGKPMQKVDILEFTAIHDDIKKELRSGKYKVKIAPSDLVDFGGQKSYDMTHQLFIQGKGTFTLIFDGRKGLQDRLAEYPQGEVTTASILKHWVDSILTYCGEDDDDILPVILFVATHRDTLKEGEQFKRMANFKRSLTEMFQSHERKTRIKYNDIFFINTTDRNDPEVHRLQTTYVNIAFQQKSWGKRMPMAWVPLELQMSKMRSRNISIISKDDLINVNKENADLALTHKQLDDFLRTQHLLGKIMYFENQGLEKYIIVQPTSLVDILRSFITDKMFFPSDPTLKQILNEMSITGKIRKKDLFKLWKQDEFSQHMPDDNFKEFVAKVLAHLDFLIEPKNYDGHGSTSDFYLVPCAVNKKPVTDFSEHLEDDKTLCLSYKLLKSSIPSALSFKLIGAVMNIWPLKETENSVCVYHKAAIMCIDNLNTLHIMVKNDRVIVYLMNAESQYFISPDIASCVQECLTLALTTSLEFYHNSFGKIVSKLTIVKLFEIEVVQKCGTETCYISLTDTNTKKPPLKCSSGRQHDTEFPMYWTYKVLKECDPGCKGLDERCLNLCPEDKHLARLARHIGIKTFDQFIINLGLSRNDWDRFEHKHQGRDPLMMQHDILCNWKKIAAWPSIKALCTALKGIQYNEHILCQIFREDRTILDLKDDKLQDVPDDETLDILSKKITNCAIHLGVELGIDFCQIEETMYKYNRDMFDQNYDILIKWKNSRRNKTIRYLMHVLNVVAPEGCKFLKEKYKIENTNTSQRTEHTTTREVNPSQRTEHLKPITREVNPSQRTERSKPTTREVNTSQRTEYSKPTTREVIPSQRTEHSKPTKPSNVASLIKKFEQISKILGFKITFF